MHELTSKKVVQTERQLQYDDSGRCEDLIFYFSKKENSIQRCVEF